jgi:hypothetical protein
LCYRILSGFSQTILCFESLRHDLCSGTGSSQTESGFHSLRQFYQLVANGHLNITPVDLSGKPTGETYRAWVNEHHKGIVTDHVTLASSFQMQIEIPKKGPFRGQLLVRLNVGPGNSSDYEMVVKCMP